MGHPAEVVLEQYAQVPLFADDSQWGIMQDDTNVILGRAVAVVEDHNYRLVHVDKQVPVAEPLSSRGDSTLERVFRFTEGVCRRD